MEEIWEKMYEEAKKVLKERQISKYVLAGSVSAAILSGSGKSTQAFVSILVPHWEFVQNETQSLI